MLFGDKEWGVRCRLPAMHLHKPTDLQTPTSNEWEKIGLYNPFLAADTQKNTCATSNYSVQRVEYGHLFRPNSSTSQWYRPQKSALS